MDDQETFTCVLVNYQDSFTAGFLTDNYAIQRFAIKESCSLLKSETNFPFVKPPFPKIFSVEKLFSNGLVENYKILWKQTPQNW